MSVLDRIFKPRATPKVPPVDDSTKPEEAFCYACGAPLVDGFLVVEDAFDTVTGRPVKIVKRGRLCSAQDGRYINYTTTPMDKPRAGDYRHTGVWEVQGARKVAVWADEVSPA